MCTKNKDGKGKGNSHSISLAHSTVVYKVDGTSDRQSNNNSKNQKLAKNSISDKKHPLQERLVLIACLVSGNCIENEVFQNKQLILSCHPGNLALKNNIRRSQKDGFNTVVKNKLIQFDQL